MADRLFHRGDRVEVAIEDWDRGAFVAAGEVRGYLGRDRVEVLLDAGANTDDPDERLTVMAPVHTVAALAQDDRRAA